MSIEFGWWAKDPDGKKFQVNVAIHGGNIEWTRKQGHHAPWEPHIPSDDDRVETEIAVRTQPLRALFIDDKHLRTRIGD